MHRLRTPLGESPKPSPPHRETRQKFPILRNEQIQNVYKNFKNLKNHCPSESYLPNTVVSRFYVSSLKMSGLRTKIISRILYFFHYLKS